MTHIWHKEVREMVYTVDYGSKRTCDARTYATSGDAGRRMRALAACARVYSFIWRISACAVVAIGCTSFEPCDACRGLECDECETIEKEDDRAIGERYVGSDAREAYAEEAWSEACGACSPERGCGIGYDCAWMTDSWHCMAMCKVSGDCPPGYICETRDRGNNLCVPRAVHGCTGCLRGGCYEGTYCDQVTFECAAIVGLCGDCHSDEQCGDRARCYAAASGELRCMPLCNEYDECPELSECKEVLASDGEHTSHICYPSLPSCCYGAECSPDPDCSNEPINKYPAPGGDRCVECIFDSQCPEERPACKEYSCVG